MVITRRQQPNSLRMTQTSYMIRTYSAKTVNTLLNMMDVRQPLSPRHQPAPWRDTCGISTPPNDWAKAMDRDWWEAAGFYLDEHITLKTVFNNRDNLGMNRLKLVENACS